MIYGNSNTKPRAEAKELLLQDYRYLSESFWKNRQTGETYVNLFVGFVTLVVGLCAVFVLLQTTM
jgi:hypothetical protein